VKFDYPVGSTPLNADEAEGLLQQHITTQGELNAWEQHNILKAQEWAFARNRSNLLTEPFVRRLHKAMFDETWEWAGEYRKSDKNIGVSWYNIPERVSYTCETVSFWVAEKTFSVDETAIRLHHMLVSVHPFPNGNGRHSRLMADLLLKKEDQPLFTWGGSYLGYETEFRKRYIDALRNADAGTIEPLLDFARS
jgi:Fic-DOC domain mobile mystery protein B